MTEPDKKRIVDDAIMTRRSVRAFLPASVSLDEISRILEVAARAPSGTNTQPWQVHVLTGNARQALSDGILAVYNDPSLAAQHREQYDYYPSRWQSPYIERRRKVGWDLYGLLGLAREDKAGMHVQHARNFTFFDAPVGLIFTIDRALGQGSWLDYGMFLQNIMIAARARGLDTCPQAAFNRFHRIISDVLQLNPESMVVCGMALGYADESRPENSLTTERAPLASFVRFLG